ncbi:acetyl-CoA carboxylase biotin carboxyl carrier protein [Verrucomicrobiota bacterium]
MDIKDIKKVVDLMTKNDLTEFALDDNGFKLELKRGSTEVTQVVHAAPAAVAPVAAAPVHVPCAPSTSVIPEAASAVEGEEIKSPIVGTFYSAASPESPVFVKEGDKVTPDTVVCIVEAMKVMNEIKAEMSGTIKKVLVENGTPVQFGEPLFIVEA